MKFKRKIPSTKEHKKGKSKRISLKAMKNWNKFMLKKTSTNKFKRKPVTRKLWIQCESTGGIVANQNLRERAQEMIERINEKSKKEPVLELLPEEISKDKYL